MADQTDPNDLDATVDDEIAAEARAQREPESDPEFPDTYTEEELERMTPAERAALTEGDDDEAPEDEPEAEPDPEPAVEPEPVDTERLGTLDASLADFARRDQEARAKLAALEDRWGEGEITDEERNTERDAILNEVAGIAAERGRVEGEAQALRAADEAQWANACRTFLAANAAFADPAHYDAFNRQVEAVTADPDFATLPYDRQLEIAARRYTDTPRGAALSLSATPETPKAEAPKAAAPEPVKPKKPDPIAADPVPTLASLPADTIDPNASNVAALAARLDREDDPLMREKIMASLPEDLQERLLSYNG